MSKLEEQPKNLICNFRAPSLDQYQRWRVFVGWAKENGMDVCHLTLSLVDAFLSGVESPELRLPKQNITIQMQNKFLYQVRHSHREPHSLESVKPEFRRTFSSILFDAYVVEKARGLNGEFCFRDFLELKYSAFRRIIRRLKRKGKIIQNPQRTTPQFYILAEKLNGEKESIEQTL